MLRSWSFDYGMGRNGHELSNRHARQTPRCLLKLSAVNIPLAGKTMLQHQWRQWLVVAVGCWAGLWHSGGAAQDVSPVNPSQPPVGEAASAEPPPEHKVYVPYRNLRAIFENEAATVFLPFQEYLRLWEHTWRSITRPADQPPVSGLITAAEYVAHVEQDTARIQATLTVQVLQKGWAEIPVKFGGAAIGTVSSEPPGVLLRGTGQGTYALLLSEPGQTTVQLELAARVITSPEGRSLVLDVPPVAQTTFELVVPEADQAIDIQPKLLQLPVEAVEKTSRVRAGLGSVEKISARWNPRAGAKPDMELLASATSAALIQVEDGLIHADVFFTIDVLRGNVEQIRIAVPKGHRILDVTSEARLREWRVSEEGLRQIVTLDLLSRTGGKIAVEVHTERPLGEEPFDVVGLAGETAHGIHLLDVLRESGQVAVRSAADLSVTPTLQQGLVRIDESEVDARIKRPGAAFYKFYNPNCRLTLAARPVEPRLLVDHRADVSFTQDQLRLESELVYTIERAGVFELTFKLPQGLTVENVACEGLKQFDVSADKALLTVSLKERRMGELKVRVTALRQRDPAAEAAGFPIPVLEPQNVELENGWLRILAIDAIDVITDSDQIAGFQPDPTADPQVASPLRLVSAWTFNRRPVNLPVRIQSKPTRLTADIGTILDVKQGQIQAVVHLVYHVDFAGLDTFRFAVPESLADRVQIQVAEDGGPPIKQKSRSAEAVDGFVTWTVVLQREALGHVRLRLTYDLAPQAGADTSQTYRAGLVRVLEPFDSADADVRKRTIPVSRLTGEVTARKDKALSVAVTATGGDVEPIDVRELLGLPQDGFVAFRYFKQPVELEIAASKYDVQEVVQTVISRGLVEVVLDRAGGAMFRGRFVIRTSERQRLAVDLPKNAEPLGVLVDRKPAALEKNPAGAAQKDWDGYYVNVARTKSSDEPFTLAVMYRLTFASPPFQQGHSNTRPLQLPIIGGGATNDVALQQLRVAVWVPEHFALVGTPPRFTPECRPSWRSILWGQPDRQACLDELQRWIGDDGGGLVDFPTEGQVTVYTNLGGATEIVVWWWHVPWYALVVSSALALIAVVLRNTRWENKLTLVLLAGLIAATYALQDADFVLHGLLVSSYGLVAMAGLWLIHGLFGRRRMPRPGSPPPAFPAAVIPPPGVFDSVTLGLQKPQS